MSGLNPKLLESFQRELSYLRQAGAAFARRYPKVAERLDFSGHESADPHVERLLESFAFLTGRIQSTLDNDFPEVPAAVLETLYPHFVQPIPSMVIAKIEPDVEEGNLETGYHIPRETELYTQADDGTLCYFRTAFPLDLWPIEIQNISLEPAINFTYLDQLSSVATVLKVCLNLTIEGDLSESKLEKLRFHIPGDHALACQLYELIFSSISGVAIKVEGREPVFLPPDVLMPSGFSEEEAILPFSQSAHHGYRLLQEYFVFPEKFLFFDVGGLAQTLSGESVELLLLLKDIPEQSISINKDSLSLNCLPLVNLFRRTTEPIRITETTHEYRLNPDIRNESTTEIHSISRVSASADNDNDGGTVAPYFSYNHAEEYNNTECFWLTKREYSERENISGTDVKLSFLDLNFDPSQPPTTVLFAQTLCTNRNLCFQLSAGALLNLEQDAPVQNITLLAKPTSQISPPLNGALYWRLVSHLSINHLPLVENSRGLTALKEVIGLYAYKDKQSVNQQINGLKNIVCRKVVRRVGRDAWRGFCDGIEIKLLIDQSMYVGASALMLGSVLNRYFGLYAACNSFTELVMEREGLQGEWKRWPALAGEQQLL